MRGRPKKNIIPFDKHESVIFDYQRGTSLSDIAKVYDVTSYEVTQVLKQNNISLRGRGRARKLASTEENKYETDYLDSIVMPLGDPIVKIIVDKLYSEKE